MSIQNFIPYSSPKTRAALVYGYLVCLISMIVALVGINTIVARSVDFAFPQAHRNSILGAQRQGFMSFQEYREREVESRISEARRIAGLPDIPHNYRGEEFSPAELRGFTMPTDAELRAAYEKDRSDAERNQRSAEKIEEESISNARYHIAREFISGIQMLITGGIIFLLHWRWVQSRPDTLVPSIPVPQGSSGAPVAP